MKISYSMFFRLGAILAMLLALIPASAGAVAPPRVSLGQAPAEKVRQSAAETVKSERETGGRAAEVQAQMETRLQDLRSDNAAADPARTVLFGKVVSVGSDTAVIKQTSFDATTSRGKILFMDDKAVGKRGSNVTLAITDRTHVQLAGGKSGLRKGKDASVKALRAGMNVIAVGSVSGQTMDAYLIGDMKAGKMEQPKKVRVVPYKRKVVPSTEQATVERSGSLSLASVDGDPALQAQGGNQVLSSQSAATADGTTLASGSMEFKGTAGGPAYTYGYTISPEVPIFSLGVFTIFLNQFNFTAALGGFVYDYPFDVDITGSPLKVYNSGSIGVNVRPVSPANGGYSFTGGVGVSADFGLHIHTVVGCGDLYLEECNFQKTVPIGVFSMINSTTAPAAMPGQTVNVPVMECPVFGVSVPGTPLTALGGGLCTAISFDGRHFKANITPSGATSPPYPSAITKAGAFDGTNPVSVPIRPTTGRVGVTLDNFSYTPYMHTGLSFRIVIGVPVYTSPSLGDLASSDFNPIPQTAERHGSGYCVIPSQCVQPDSYTLEMPAASAVTSVTPMNGPASQSTRVTVGGGGFNGFIPFSGLSVFFGDPSNIANRATLVPPWTDNEIIVDAPSKSASTVDVYVKTGCGESSTTTCLTSDANPPYTTFKYLPKPTVTHVQPINGPASAEPIGTRDVTITGTGFTTARSVKFGTIAAPSFEIITDSTIVAAQPVDSSADVTAKTVDVTVTTACARDEGTLWPTATSCLTSETNSNDKFTFLPKPTITGLSPATGLTTGNTKLTITGTGFTTTSAVNFGSSAAIDWRVDSDTQISATVPEGTGKVDVTVTTTCGLDLGQTWPTATSCLTSPVSAASRMTYVSILALNPTASGALSINGGGKLVSSTGNVVVDSSNDRAVIGNGQSTLTALETWIVGRYRLTGDSTINPAPITGSGVMIDPFAFLSAPSAVGMELRGNNLSVDADTTLQPGIYAGGITVSEDANVTFAPGTYVLQGGGLTVEGQSSVQGEDVVLSFGPGSSGCGDLKVAGGSTLSLSAAAPTSTNPYGGVVVYMDRACESSGAQITGVSSSATLSGALYAPHGELSLNGAASMTVGAVVADTITLNQGATLKTE